MIITLVYLVEVLRGYVRLDSYERVHQPTP